MRSIFWGVVIIAIGLLRGDSVFHGDFSLLTVFFDALGAFFIVRGLLAIKAARAAAAPPPASSPPPARSSQMR